jgi:hypothetical protein
VQEGQDVQPFDTLPAGTSRSAVRRWLSLLQKQIASFATHVSHDVQRAPPRTLSTFRTSAPPHLRTVCTSAPSAPPHRPHLD